MEPRYWLAKHKGFMSNPHLSFYTILFENWSMGSANLLMFVSSRSIAGKDPSMPRWNRGTTLKACSPVVSWPRICFIAGTSGLKRIHAPGTVSSSAYITKIQSTAFAFGLQSVATCLWVEILVCVNSLLPTCSSVPMWALAVAPYGTTMNHHQKLW